VVRGRDDVFLTGASAATLRAIVGHPEIRRTSQGAVNHLTLAQFADFPLPVVGAIEGHAIGGGLSFALTLCDVTVAAEESRYGFNYATLGFTPGMGTTSLVSHLVGQPFANEMILTGKLYRGQALSGRGLFSEVVPKAQVTPEALDIARRMAAVPRRTLEILKGTLALPRQQWVHAGHVQEDLMHRLTLDDPEALKRIEASYTDAHFGK
jgi:polyketide biosynthesis enoyl-CoA hydratase PksI